MWFCVPDGMLDGCGSERDCGASERGTTTIPTGKKPEGRYIEGQELYIVILTD